MVFLIHSAELGKPKWYIAEGETKEDVTNCDCFAEAMGETLSDMLHGIQDSGDETVYVVLSDINSKGVRKDKEYPKHVDLAMLIGYVPEVCDVAQFHRPSIDDGKWEVDFPLEMWIRECDTLEKVQGFTELILKDVDDYINMNGLVYDYKRVRQ